MSIERSSAFGTGSFSSNPEVRETRVGASPGPLKISPRLDWVPLQWQVGMGFIRCDSGDGPEDCKYPLPLAALIQRGGW